MREVQWRRQALDFIEEYLEWYYENMGKNASTNFLNGIKEDVERLRISPHIGRREPDYFYQGLTIRSLLLYKHYRLLYGYDNEQLIIVALWDVRRITNSQ